MEKERYYAFMSGRIRLETGSGEDYPLHGDIISTEGCIIEKGEDVIFLISL